MSHPLYSRWLSMKNRCHDKRHRCYKNYGGRGIKVCKRWHKFDNFVTDMGMPPDLKWTIDRIDNDGDYSPENCQWLPRGENNKKKRTTVMVPIGDGKTMTLADAARHFNLNPESLKARLRKGIPLTHPKRFKYRGPRLSEV